MEKILRIVKKGEDDSNILYWLKLTTVERLVNLEALRQEINKIKYGNRQGLRRVYSVVKRIQG